MNQIDREIDEMIKGDNKMDIIEKHKEMVMRLGKPGKAILDTLTPEDCYLMHMGGCLMGEAAELYEAIHKGENPLEELGDFQFYFVAVSSIFGMERENWGLTNDEFREVGLESPDEEVTAVTMLMFVSGNFWDVVKRAVVYRKPVDKEKAVMVLRQIELLLSYIQVIGFRIPLDAVLEANYTKLADKDKGRYGSGAYSDEQAQARRDKQ